VRQAFHGEIQKEHQRQSESELPPALVSRPVHSQSRPTQNPSRPTDSQFRQTDIPSRPNHIQPGAKANHHKEYKPIYPHGPAQSRPNYRRRGPARPSIDTHLRPVQGGAVSIQNKQTYGRRQITDKGTPVSRPHVMKDKLVDKGYLTRDEDVKNRNSISNANRFGLLIQDPHASVYDIPTREEVRAHNGPRDMLEDTVNKNQRRRAAHLNTRARPRLGDVNKLFLRAGPPYPGPNPRNPALPLDKTVIYP
jgi:hypothetical protein